MGFAEIDSGAGSELPESQLAHHQHHKLLTEVATLLAARPLVSCKEIMPVSISADSVPLHGKSLQKGELD